MPTTPDTSTPRPMCPAEQHEDEILRRIEADEYFGPRELPLPALGPAPSPCTDPACDFCHRAEPAPAEPIDYSDVPF